MPIQAAANRLKRELEEAGAEPDAAAVDAAAVAVDAAAASAAAPAGSTATPGVFKGKKTKLVVKSGGASSQYDIMVKSGVPEDEIPAFVVRIVCTCACAGVCLFVVDICLCACAICV
jgi:hypothetical protein